MIVKEILYSIEFYTAYLYSDRGTVLFSNDWNLFKLVCYNPFKLIKSFKVKCRKYKKSSSESTMNQVHFLSFHIR